MRLAMRFVAQILIGLICATLWLAMLVATGFSSLIIGMGLLAALVLMNRSG